jgi:hypothetical protein
VRRAFDEEVDRAAEPSDGRRECDLLDHRERVVLLRTFRPVPDLRSHVDRRRSRRRRRSASYRSSSRRSGSARSTDGSWVRASPSFPRPLRESLPDSLLRAPDDSPRLDRPRSFEDSDALRALRASSLDRRPVLWPRAERPDELEERPIVPRPVRGRSARPRLDASRRASRRAVREDRVADRAERPSPRRPMRPASEAPRAETVSARLRSPPSRRPMLPVEPCPTVPPRGR